MATGECKIQNNNQPVAPRYSHTITNRVLVESQAALQQLLILQQAMAAEGFFLS